MSQVDQACVEPVKSFTKAKKQGYENHGHPEEKSQGKI
jgi:hypothetical protein